MNQETPTARTVTQRRGHPVLALVFITLGVLILLQNFNLYSGNIWEMAWKFWPLILILWGIQAILGNNRIGAFIVFIIGLIMVGALITLPMLGYFGGEWFTVSNVKEERQNFTVGSDKYLEATTRRVTIDNGVGKVELDDSDSQDVMRWDSTFFSGYAPEVQHSLDGSEVRIDIDAQHKNGLSWFMNSSPRYNLTLGRPDLETSVRVDSGLGEVKVRFEELKLSSLNLQIGTGSANVTLEEPSVPSSSSTIDVGTGSCKVFLPEDVGIKLVYNVGLGSVKVEGDSLRGDGTYTSPNYDTAMTKFDLKVNIGTGSLTIVK